MKSIVRGPARAIWKWSFRVGDVMSLTMPAGAVILTLQLQDGVPCIWAEIDERAPLEERTFMICGTGHSFLKADADRYIGTWQDGGFVWHLYERAPWEKATSVGSGRGSDSR